MCWFIPLIIAGVSAVSQFQANKKATAAEVDSANFNIAEQERAAQISREKAKQAFDHGEMDRDNYMRSFAQEQGERAANMGASGLDVNSGSNLTALADSAAMAELDGNTLRHNAANEVWGHNQDARNSLTQAYLSRKGKYDAIEAGKTRNKTILVNTAGSMASSYFGGAAGAAGRM